MRIWSVGESALLNSSRDILHFGNVDISWSNVVSAVDGPPPANFDKSDRLTVSGLKPYRCASGNIKSVTVSLEPVKIQLRIGLNEVIMRSDLTDQSG